MYSVVIGVRFMFVGRLQPVTVLCCLCNFVSDCSDFHVMSALRENLSEEDKRYIENMERKMKEHIDKYDGKYEWSLNDFEVGSFLGKGRFGRVYLVRERSTHFKVAIKVLCKSEIVKCKLENQILRETEIQSKLRHPHILTLFTYFYDKKKIYYVLEFAARGELFSHLRKAGRFLEPTSAKYTYQVADALRYCHLNNVIHRDLKPENLLVDAIGDVKLADFGWSVHAPSDRRKTMCGTLDYIPPEMVVGEAHNRYVDNWCLGVLCYEFLNGSPPFESPSHAETYKKITDGSVVYTNVIPPGARDLISRLLKRVPETRITLPDVMLHPWIQANKVKALPVNKYSFIK